MPTEKIVDVRVASFISDALLSPLYENFDSQTLICEEFVEVQTQIGCIAAESGLKDFEAIRAFLDNIGIFQAYSVENIERVLKSAMDLVDEIRKVISYQLMKKGEDNMTCEGCNGKGYKTKELFLTCCVDCLGTRKARPLDSKDLNLSLEKFLENVERILKLCNEK